MQPGIGEAFSMNSHLNVQTAEPRASSGRLFHTKTREKTFMEFVLLSL